MVPASIWQCLQSLTLHQLTLCTQTMPFNHLIFLLAYNKSYLTNTLQFRWIYQSQIIKGVNHSILVLGWSRLDKFCETSKSQEPLEALQGIQEFPGTLVGKHWNVVTRVRPRLSSCWRSTACATWARGTPEMVEDETEATPVPENKLIGLEKKAGLVL